MTAPMAAVAQPVALEISDAYGIVRPYTETTVPTHAYDRLFEEEYTVYEALEFYEKIADHYDQRNSARLIGTHRETARAINQIRAGRTELRVLDLGGGTGLHVASSFIDDQSTLWEYVDFSHAMSNQLRAHLSGSTLANRIRMHHCDIHEILPALEPRAYDVVLISLVLSSMPKTPAFENLARLVAPGGAILISDIDPTYAALHPYYAVEVNGTRYALRLNPINPHDVFTAAEAFGYRPSHPLSVADNAGQPYSFIAKFQSAR